jgi:DNA-binding transcriptional LysR family regulator
MVEVRQLQYFVALSKDLSFARAAERQHITQSALSQQIARLERDLGVTLFQRSVRGATPTPAGEMLLPQAQRVLAELADLRARAASIAREAHQELRIGSPTYAVRSRARQRVVAGFTASNPGTDIRFENAWSARLLESLVAGDLDLSFAMLAPDLPALEFVLVQSEPALLILPAGHRLAQHREVGLADLAGERVVLYPDTLNSWLYEQMSVPLARAGVRVGELEESSLPAVLEQVRNGAGLFPAVPWEMDFVNPDQLDGLAVVKTSGERGLLYGMWLARRTQGGTPAIDAFWEIARDLGLPGGSWTQPVGEHLDTPSSQHP